MIESILSFSLKSTMCSAVFLGYYMLVLKNVHTSSFNRVYLLVATLLSLLLPFTRFELLNIATVVSTDFPLLHITARGAEEVSAVTASPHAFNWQAVLTSIYFSVAVMMLLKLVAKFIWVYRLKRKGLENRMEGFTLIKTDDPHAPFSFMNMLFWPVDMPQESAEGKGILMHEMAHIDQHHTLDKIFMQLMLAACWLNPFNWLIRNEVWLQHEFLADRSAVKDGDTETFARMLLYTVTNSSDRSVISPFFQSPVKRRLFMLSRSGKSRYVLLRRFLSIPVLFSLILLLSAYTPRPANNVLRSPKKIVLVLDAAHGGEDGGGKSIYGHLEKDFTLAICKKLIALSGEYNIEVITTRNEDVYAPLPDRLQTSNNTDNAIFLSVHVNKNTATDIRGNSYELGVNPKSRNYDKSILLASAIASKLKNQKLPVRVVDHSKVYVIRENSHPALLIECGNMDDADNIALLSDETRKELLCRNILSGIVDYNARLATK